MCATRSSFSRFKASNWVLAESYRVSYLCGLTLVGMTYFLGEAGIEQNYAEAVKWFKLAAEQGHSVAQFKLGLCFKLGLGVIYSPEEAVKLYKLSADQGNSSAQHSFLTGFQSKSRHKYLTAVFLP